MNQDKYTLEKYRRKNTRFTCPSCLKQFQLTRYVSSITGNYLAKNVGICNRVNKCGYHYSPKQYFKDNNLFVCEMDTSNKHSINSVNEKSNPTRKNTKIHNSIDYIDNKIFEQSLHGYAENKLIKYLLSILDKKTVYHLINIYKIGTSKKWKGGTTIFWQIDKNGNIRTGKLIKYNSQNGKRIKSPFSHINWAHSLLKAPNYKLKQCLFGEHLLIEDPKSTVALVESEKTAIIFQAKIPDLIWLATGSIQNFNKDILEPLKNRKVIAFPDIGAYERWQNKAKQLPFKIFISDYLEKNASPDEIKKGFDIADYL